MTCKMKKWINIDLIYSIVSALIIVLVIESRDVIDVVYLGLVTYYYIRVKIYRKKVSKQEK